MYFYCFFILQNVRVWAQNAVPSRPLSQLPSLRENDCQGSPGGSTPQQINNHRNFEKGSELPQQMQTECSRPPVFPEIRPPIPNVLRLPIETVAAGSRPCPPPSVSVQQPNLPPLQPSPLPPRIPNLFSLPREQIQSNLQTNLPPVTSLPVQPREQCTQCSQDPFPQQTPSIIPQPNRLPPPLFSSLNPFRFFNSNPLSLPEPLTSTFPVMSQVPGILLQEPTIQNNIVPPNPSSFIPNNLVGPIETVPTLPVSPPCIDATYGPTNTLPPLLPLSPMPNFPTPFLPLNPFRSLFFGPNSIHKPYLNPVPPYPAENCASNCPSENPNGQNLPLNPITSPCALPAVPLNSALPPFDITHSLAFSNPNSFGPQINSNEPVQQNSLIPPQQCPINNAPILPKAPYTQPPTSTNVFQSPIGIPNLSPLPVPLLSAAYPPLVSPPNPQPPCTLTSDLSSIGFLPTARNSFNSIPKIPTNVVAPVYQTNALPPVVTGPINDIPCQSSKIEEIPIPITLQINIPAPTIPAPKIILVTPPPAPPTPVIEEDAVELFEPYPLPPIIVEGRRSRSKSWLPLFLVALFAGDGCGFGGGCCDCSSGPTMVPYPMPVPTNNPVVFN